MSYTITISGTSAPTDGQSQDQADQAVAAKARAFAQSLPAVSAGFIQTMSGGMENLNPPPAPPVEAPPEQAQEAPSV